MYSNFQQQCIIEPTRLIKRQKPSLIYNYTNAYALFNRESYLHSQHVFYSPKSPKNFNTIWPNVYCSSLQQLMKQQSPVHNSKGNPMVGDYPCNICVNAYLQWVEYRTNLLNV